jgi:formamidopyrimidine-DNA glycosylase
MPELPEVEIHARNLRAWLIGNRVESYTVLDPKLDLDSDVALWERALVGRSVLAVRREAKYLLIDLDGEHTLVAHLRMTGRFVRDSYIAGRPEKHTRFALTLDDGSRVRFEDRRRFGRLWVAPTDEVRTLPELTGLGPDALLQPTSAELLRAATSRSRRSIKTLLMDQRVIGGLGNICVIEILYRAGIAPQTPASTLTDAQVGDIARLIPSFLEWAIEVQGRRELIYLGEKGAENVFTIYARAGSPCPKCGETVARSVLSGRGTYYCPGCQR